VDDTGTASAPGATHVVEFSHTYFTPGALTIAAGDMVLFRNVADMNHPLLSTRAGLDSGAFPQGERSSTFSNSGSFTITNLAHGTTMTLVVQGTGGESLPSQGVSQPPTQAEQTPTQYDSYY